MRPGQINMTRWFSKHKTLRSGFKSESCFLAILITLQKILNADKSVYNLSDDQFKTLSKMYTLWNQPETIIFGTILLSIFDMLQNDMSYLQTSGLEILDVHTCIHRCNDYLFKLKSNCNESVLPGLFAKGQTFLFSIIDQLKTDEQ